MTGTIGVIALARPTFDVPFAEETAARAFAAHGSVMGLPVVDLLQ